MKKLIYSILICSLSLSIQAQGSFWGAIGYNIETGAWAYAVDHRTASEARDEVKRRCGDGCSTRTFTKCAAMAYSEGDGWLTWSGYGDTQEEAERKALELCRRNDNNCRIVAWGCNTIKKDEEKDEDDEYWDNQEGNLGPCVVGTSQSRKFYFDNFDRCSIWCPQAREWIREICTDCAELKIESCNCNERTKPYYAEVKYTCNASSADCSATETIVKKERVYYDNFDRCSIWCPDAIAQIKDKVGEGFQKISCNCNERNKPYFAEVVYKVSTPLDLITIISPSASMVTSKNVITVKGKVQRSSLNSGVNEVIIEVNNVKLISKISSSGYFESKVVLAAGDNTIKIYFRGCEELAKTVTVKNSSKPSKFKATLVWDGSGDLDLHVKDVHKNITCYYSNKKPQDNFFLDVDNTSSYGPENIAIIDDLSPLYEVSVINYSSGNGRKATVYIFINEELIEVKDHVMRSSKEKWAVGSYEIR